MALENAVEVASFVPRDTQGAMEINNAGLRHGGKTFIRPSGQGISDPFPIPSRSLITIIRHRNALSRSSSDPLPLTLSNLQYPQMPLTPRTSHAFLRFL